MRLFSVLLSLLCWSAGASAWQSPKEAIDRFLAFELDGGRLDSTNWQAYTTKYVAAPADYAEPGWDRIVVVRSAKVGAPVCKYDNQCSSRVRYKLLPTKELRDAHVVAHDKGGSEVVTYSIVKVDTEWLIAPDFGAPRVREAAYRKFRNSRR